MLGEVELAVLEQVLVEFLHQVLKFDCGGWIEFLGAKTVRVGI